MFQSIFKLGLFVLIALGLSGCSTSTLDLVHNSMDETTTINMGKENKYKVTNSRKMLEGNSSQSLFSMRPSTVHYTSSGICKNLFMEKLPPLGRNEYYDSSAKADVYNMLKNRNCMTEKVRGLEFHRCDGAFSITYEKNNSEGHLTEKRYLFLANEDCFFEIKKAAGGQ